MTYLIAGGAPAGMNICPGDDGCRTTIISINITTISGNSSTSPRGTETFELPFKRIRLLKNPKCDKPLSFFGAHSSIEASDGRLGDDGILLASVCIKVMVMAGGFTATGARSE